METKAASVMRQPKKAKQEGIKDRAAELDQDELTEPKNNRKQVYDELNDKLSSGFYITNKGFAWLYDESGGQRSPLFVDRFYSQINVAIDFECDPIEADIKDRLFREHDIRYGNLIDGMQWDGLIKNLLGK